MSVEMPEAMKAEFIEAFQARFGFGVMFASADVDAGAMFVAAAWAWKASRAGLALELPSLENFKDDESAHGMLVMCRHLIQSAGLKVAP